jgi:Sulfotransferase family
LGHIAPMEGRAPLRVIYVAGISHSGSTIVGRTLGELEGAFYGGELRQFWERGILENRTCTCGAPFADCPFWRAVVDRLPFPAWEKAEELSRLHRRLTRRTALRVAMRRSIREREETAFANATEALYRAIADVTGAAQIVDSSKSPVYAALLHRTSAIDLRIVHLLRDPRATAYSSLRRNDFGYRGALEHAIWWMRWNAAVERLSESGVPCVRIRYEDFVSDPIVSLERITHGLSLPASPFPFEGRFVRLSSGHLFSANRSRTETGLIEIRNDAEWHLQLEPRVRALVSATTFPMRNRYGYGGG